VNLPKPYYQDESVVIYHADCRDILPSLPKVDLVLTDPPYGVGKAEWDKPLDMAYLDLLPPITKKAIAIMPGNSNLLSMPERVGGFSYKWTLAVWVSNALVRGAFGFGNWIPCLVYAKDGQSVYACSQDCHQIVIRGDMPEHPSPKPYDAMKWLVTVLPDGLILDPFMGSGTTLRAAKDLGRKAIGIEIEEKYCEIAAKRMAQTVMDLRCE